MGGGDKVSINPLWANYMSSKFFNVMQKTLLGGGKLKTLSRKGGGMGGILKIIQPSR